MESEGIRVDKVCLSAESTQRLEEYCVWIPEGNCRVSTDRKEIDCTWHDVLMCAPGTYSVFPERPQHGLLIRVPQSVLYGGFVPVLQGCPLLMNFFFCETERELGDFLRFEQVDAPLRAMPEKMHRDYLRQEPYVQSVLACDLMSFLLTLCQRCRVAAVLTEPPNRQLYQQIVAYMTEHCQEATLQHVAEHFHYHPNTIARLVRQNAGCTYQALRQSIRLSQAAWQILGSQGSIEEIALRCGYHNMSNFYAQFRKKYGVNPGDYAQVAAGKQEILPIRKEG